MLGPADTYRESLPVEKTDIPDTREKVSPIERANLCFLGTSVESGSATAVIVATGPQTYFGSVASSLAGQQPEMALVAEGTVSWSMAG